MTPPALSPIDARSKASKRILLIAALLLAAIKPGHAQIAQKVVDIPTRPGITERMIVLAPAEPRAAVILLAGGHGGLQIFPNGSMKWGDGNFLVRSRQRFAEQGLLVCGSGTGMAIAANKVPGVRAAACYSVEVARNSREHNDANVLTLGSKTVNSAQMREIVGAWLATEISEDRHRKRVSKIEAIERQYLR